MRETKKTIAFDIMELINWCITHHMTKGCDEIIEKYNQHRYTSPILLFDTLMYKKKQALDNIRTELLKGIYEGF